MINIYRNKMFVRSIGTKLSYIHQVGEESLMSLTIGQLFDKSVRKYPNREAIVSCHEGEKMTFSEIKELVCILLNYLFKQYFYI